MRLTLLSLIASLSLFAAPSSPRIPDLQTTSFAGKQVSLPAALRGHKAVLIVGFSKNSRTAVTEWSRRLAVDYRDSPTVLYFELPVLAEVPRLLRGVVLHQIKQEIPIRAHPGFLPILDHEDQWKSATGYTRQQSDDDAYLLLVDDQGIIHQRLAAGPPTDQTYATLKRNLDELNP